ncbi:MAG: hypothetical protein HRU15_03140 [Planctomycetes bacterium]|nr:hypothetical protein [Planctomycetota bacterium]
MNNNSMHPNREHLPSQIHSADAGIPLMYFRGQQIRKNDLITAQVDTHHVVCMIDTFHKEDIITVHVQQHHPLNKFIPTDITTSLPINISKSDIWFLHLPQSYGIYSSIEHISLDKQNGESYFGHDQLAKFIETILTLRNIFSASTESAIRDLGGIHYLSVHTTSYRFHLYDVEHLNFADDHVIHISYNDIERPRSTGAGRVLVIHNDTGEIYYNGNDNLEG